MADTEAYSEGFDKSFYVRKTRKNRRSIEMNVLHLKETMLMNSAEFRLKIVVLLVTLYKYLQRDIDC